MTGKSLMSQYIEGTIVGRELRDMLNENAASDRFDRELALMDFNHQGSVDSETNDAYQDFMREQVNESA